MSDKYISLQKDLTLLLKRHEIGKKFDISCQNISIYLINKIKKLENDVEKRNIEKAVCSDGVGER